MAVFLFDGDFYYPEGADDVTEEAPSSTGGALGLVNDFDSIDQRHGAFGFSNSIIDGLFDEGNGGDLTVRAIEGFDRRLSPLNWTFRVGLSLLQRISFRSRRQNTLLHHFCMDPEISIVLSSNL